MCVVFFSCAPPTPEQAEDGGGAAAAAPRVSFSLEVPADPTGPASRAQLDRDLSLFATEADHECARGMRGFVRRFSLAAQARVMGWVRDSTPFAWIRWGDGNTLALRTDERLRRALRRWGGEGPRRLFVSIGMWWMCRADLRLAWNRGVDADGLGSNTTATLVDHFYLTQGDPANPEVYRLREQGIRGWVIEAQDRVVCLVGPGFTASFRTFLFHSEFIEIPRRAVDVDAVMRRMRQVVEKYAPLRVLFAVVAGDSAKIIITEAFLSPWGGLSSYVDVGSAMDGFAGVASKDFIHIPSYCRREAEFVPDPTDRKRRVWMKRGVCDNPPTVDP